MSSSSIENQTWELVNQVNYQLHQEQKAQKRGQARIAEANHAQGKLQTTKDIILPSAGDGQAKAASKGMGAEGKPKLPAATRNFNAFLDEEANEGGKTLGLIAIIGEVMALQAKSNSNFWSTMWKQASQTMQMEVKYAPIMADSIKNAYTAQSLATKAQSNQSYQDGFINLGMFVGAIAVAGIMEFASNPMGEIGPDQGDTLVNDETGNAERGAQRTAQRVQGDQIQENAIQNENQSANRVENQANRAMNNENAPPMKKLKKFGKVLSDFAQGAQKRMISILGKGMQSAMAFDMASKGITGLFVDSKFQAQQATEQALEGQAQALSKESEQYSQFYGQCFSRSDQQTSAGQQNIDSAMSILKSAADTITGTVTSMFRG